MKTTDYDTFENLQARGRLAIESLYHNASVPCVETQNEYEEALFQEYFGLYANTAFEDLNGGDLAGLEDFPNTFGEAFQYGRGGRTVAPAKLVSGGVYWRLEKGYFLEKFQEIEDLAELRAEVELLERFNTAVREFCAGVPAWWEQEKIELDLQADIDAKDGKRPVQVTVWK